MKVSELIEMLNKTDLDAEVFVNILDNLDLSLGNPIADVVWQVNVKEITLVQKE